MTTYSPNRVFKLKEDLKHFSPTVGGGDIIYLICLLIYVLTHNFSGKVNSLDADMMVVVVVITLIMIKSH
jgi:hypothetical protein